MRLRERHAVLMLLAVSALLGTAFALITPIWANVEEPAHFEVIRAVVDERAIPGPGYADPVTRQRIIDSYVWVNDRWGLAGEMWNARVREVWGIDEPEDWRHVRAALAGRPGYDSLEGRAETSTPQFGEAPGYYVLAALPQLLLPRARVEVQLLAARLTSVALGVLAVWLAALAARELFPDRRTGRLAGPALLALLPSFVVLQSTVNNTIAAVAAVSFAVYAMVRMVRRGLSPVNGLLLAVAAAACLLSKSTAYVVLPVLVLALPLARRRAWPRWLVGGLAAAGVLALVLVTGWQWPASWYPLSDRAEASQEAPLGDRALSLEPGADPAQLWQVVPGPTVKGLRGQRVTLGAWVQAADGADAQPPALWSAAHGEAQALIAPEETAVTPGEAWSFAGAVVDIPADAQCVSVRVEAPGAYDGLVLAAGERPLDEPPVFDSDRGQNGQWGGSAFENILLNGSLERGQPVLRPEVERLIPQQFADTALSISARLATFWDWRANQALVILTARWLFSSFWSRYGWVSPGLPAWIVAGLAVLTLLSVVGLVAGAVRRGRSWPLWQRRALALTALAGFVVALVALLRLDPVYIPPICTQYQGRFVSTGYYIVPGALPILLVWYAGLEAWLPARWHRWLLAGCVLGFFGLTMGMLFGAMLPNYLTAYGVDVPATLLVQLWGGLP